MFRLVCTLIRKWLQYYELHLHITGGGGDVARCSGIILKSKGGKKASKGYFVKVFHTFFCNSYQVKCYKVSCIFNYIILPEGLLKTIHECFLTSYWTVFFQKLHRPEHLFTLKKHHFNSLNNSEVNFSNFKWWGDIEQYMIWKFKKKLCFTFYFLTYTQYSESYVMDNNNCCPVFCWSIPFEVLSPKK